jgi:hypothetical protein
MAYSFLLIFPYLEHLELHPRDRSCLQQLLGNGRDVVPVDDDAAIRAGLQQALHVLLNGLRT